MEPMTLTYIVLVTSLGMVIASIFYRVKNRRWLGGKIIKTILFFILFLMAAASAIKQIPLDEQIQAVVDSIMSSSK